MSCLYRCDQFAGMNPLLLNSLGAGYVCVSVDVSKAPIVLHVSDGTPSPDGSAPIWDFAAQGTWGRFAGANPTIARAVRPHVFGGEEATVAGLAGPNDPRFFPNPQPTT